MIAKTSNSTRSDLKALSQRTTRLKKIGRSAWRNLLNPSLATLYQSACLSTPTFAITLIKCLMIWFTVLLIRYLHVKNLNRPTYPLCIKVRDSIFLTRVAFLLVVWLVCAQSSFAERTSQLLTLLPLKCKVIFALLWMRVNLLSGAKRSNRRSTGTILVTSRVSKRLPWRNFWLKTHHRSFTSL